MAKKGEEMKKIKMSDIIVAILGMALIAISIFSESIPIAIIAGSLVIADAITQKDIVKQTYIQAEKVEVYRNGEAQDNGNL